MDGDKGGRGHIRRGGMRLLMAAAVALSAPQAALAAIGLDQSFASQPEMSANESRPLGIDSGWLNLGDESISPVSPRRDTAGSISESNANSGMWAGGELVRVFGSMAVVLAIIGFLVLVVRRLGRGGVGPARSGGVLEILARYPMARGHALLLLKVNRRLLLVHQGGGSMTTLSEITDGDEVRSLLDRIEPDARDTFSARFRAALRTRAREQENPFKYVETVDLTRPSSGPRAENGWRVEAP